MQTAHNNKPDLSVHHGQTCSPIIDLRQYTLYPGTRDTFVELFDREFVETQETVGMRIIGQFRDIGDPNRFVWIRGFQDMPSREKALTEFYMHGAAWKTHSETARSMMIDSTDALLLHPARPNSGFLLESAERRPSLDSAAPQGIIVATIYHLQDPADAIFLDFFESAVTPVLVDAGASMLASFVTEYSPNNFPRLVLRERENVYITFSGFRDLVAYHKFITERGQNPHWRSDTYPALMTRISGRPQILRLSPTSRSQLRALLP